MPVPGRVESALTYLKYCDWVKNPMPLFDGMQQEARELSAKEERVEDAALTVLCDYFTCRADFGDSARNHTSDSGADQELDDLHQRVAKLEKGDRVS